MLGGRNVPHPGNEGLPLISIDSSRITRASIILSVWITTGLATLQGLFFTLRSSGHVHGLRIFAHWSLFIVVFCSLSVGHTVNLGCKPSGAFTKLSTAPSTSNPVTSGAAA